MKRRALLATIGTATVAVQAGCLADDGDPGTDDGTSDADGGGDAGGPGAPDGDGDANGDGRTDAETESPAEESAGGDGERDDAETDDAETDDPAEGSPSEPDVEPVLVDSSVETTGTDCAGDQRGDASVEFHDDAVTVEGVATTPNPCHEAVLESASVEAGELAVELGFESTSEMCVDCVGAISYEARFDVDGAAGLDTVTVDYGEHGGSFGVSRASDEAGPPPEETPVDATPSEPADTERHPSREANPNLPIIVENRHDEPHEIQVTIARESGDVVYDEAVAFDAESNERVYNLSQADPDGIEAFAVRAAADGQTASARVQTDDCHGRVIVAMTADGDLDVTYSVC